MHDEELARFNAAVYRKYRRLLGLMVAEGRRANVFRRVDPEEAGAFILAVVDGISLQRMFDPKALTLEPSSGIWRSGDLTHGAPGEGDLATALE